MTIEVLVATMHRHDWSIVEKMNITTSATIINQSDRIDNMYLPNDSGFLRMITTKERGLSRSRNMAIRESRSEICVLADDDVVYNDGYEKTIVEAYKTYPRADIIAFAVPTENAERRKTYPTKARRISYLRSMKISSYEITFRRESILGAGVGFNERFGAGSNCYDSGEENIFLFDCIRKGLKVFFVPKIIGRVSHESSTWFRGYNEKFFFDKGATFAAMFKRLSVVMIAQFLVRKRCLYSGGIGLFEAARQMFEGMRNYDLYSRESSFEDR